MITFTRALRFCPVALAIGVVLLSSAAARLLGSRGADPDQER
jgi:hypothetical protein